MGGMESREEMQEAREEMRAQGKLGKKSLLSG